MACGVECPVPIGSYHGLYIGDAGVSTKEHAGVYHVWLAFGGGYEFGECGALGCVVEDPGFDVNGYVVFQVGNGRG